MIEIEPGAIVNVGTIIDPAVSLAMGTELTASHARLVSNFPNTHTEFRYQIMNDSEKCAWVSLTPDCYDQLEVIMQGINATVSVSDLDAYETACELVPTEDHLDALIQDKKYPQLGWHVDSRSKRCDVRFITNLGAEASTVLVATEWELDDLRGMPDIMRVPRSYKELKVEPGETYVINNIATHEKLTPHATPKAIGRIMLCQHIEARFSSPTGIKRDYREGGGLKVFFTKPTTLLGLPDQVEILRAKRSTWYTF